MKDARALLDRLMQSGGDLAAKAREAFDSQPAGGKGAIAGGILGTLFSVGRGSLGTVARIGATAVIGSIASRAYADWKAGRALNAAHDETTATDPKFLPDTSDAADDMATRLLQAMVAAAKADGRVTKVERAKITEQLETLGLGPDASEALEAELASPLDANGIAALARSPEEATGLYAASLLVVRPNGKAEKEYLATLAGKLKLDPGLVEHLHAKAGQVA
jgi:uncharacterized membrane protein YebE (DUF533 family)